MNLYTVDSLCGNTLRNHSRNAVYHDLKESQPLGATSAS